MNDRDLKEALNKMTKMIIKLGENDTFKALGICEAIKMAIMSVADGRNKK